MTRTRLLQLLVQQARANGFDFRKWFTNHVGIPWTGADHAVEWLSRSERCSILLFSRSFAEHFWRRGQRVTFLVPAQQFQRIAQDGSVQVVNRRAHLRQSSRENVWQFHLSEMAAASQPLRYIRRYLIVDEAVGETLSRNAPLADVQPPEDTSAA